jgi:DNA-binding CsgD family transcriptional regulator
MATRVSSARFVGRVDQIAELCSALEDAAALRPSLAFLAGESGSGKTRLIGELASRARESGALVLCGDCVELGEGELPYAPLIAALRPLVRAQHPALAAMDSSQRADLATVIPGAGAPSAEAPVEQVRVFEALLALLEILAEDAPVLLVVEDVHWADSSTRSFLSFLTRTLSRERILMVASYRSDELHRRHPLRPLLAEVVRDRFARIVEIPLLSTEEMTEQLEDILGRTPDPALTERLYTRSEGNPLFTEELLAAGLDGRGSLPPTLRDALMLRVEQLPDRAQKVLRWLAVQPADDTLLADLAELDSGDLREGLREAVSSHIVVAGADGSFAFRHALLREVVYDDLLPGERAELHARLARALQQSAESQDKRVHLTAQIAHHWLAAGDQPAAFAAAVRAAAAAESVNAYGEALGLLERALALWDRVPDPEALAGGDQVSLLMRAANVADVAGESVRQDALLRQALGLTDESSDPRRAALVLERLARAQGSLNRQDEALVTIERALALLPADDRSPERAALLAAGARARMLQSRFADAADRARAALAAARQLDDGRAVEVRALNSLGVALAGLGDFDAGAAALREALARSDTAELIDEQNMTYVNLADLLAMSGRAEEGLDVARQGLAQSQPGTRGSDWIALGVTELAYHCGRWEEADEAIPSSARRGSGTLLTFWRLMRSLLALGRGDLDTAAVELDIVARALRDSTEVQFIGSHGWMKAELERRSDRPETAREVVDDSLDRIEFCSEDMPRIAAVAAVGVRVEADAAQRARDVRDAEAERRARRRGAAMLERVELAASASGPVERAELASARAEDARAAGRDDPGAWEDAARAWLDLGRPYPALYARLRQAEALVVRDARAAAADVAAGGRDEARQLGSEWLVEAFESLGARARLRLGEERAPATAGTSEEPDEHPFGLTAREQQVLALVASGATNRQIGGELHMAEKTASVHVSRILAKLDVRSRTEAAALAHRQGLTRETPRGVHAPG